MRITNNTMNNSFINSLNKNLLNMQKAQERLSSMKKVSRPSDDPLLVGKILSMKDNIKQNEQYNSNISAAKGWVQTQDTAMGDVTKTMNRIRDLIVYGANDSLSPSDRTAIQDEVKMKVGEIKDVLNTNFDGRYIFGGQKTGSAPFLESAVEPDSDKLFDKDGKEILRLTYDGDGNDIKREIAQGVTIELKTNGGDIITIKGDTPADDKTLGEFLQKVVLAMDEITDDGTTQLSGDLLGEADKFIDNILRVRSNIGAIDNRLEAAEERNRSENINLTSVLSEKEDIDIAEEYMKYTMMTTAYQTSLSVGAKILQPSLLDFLR